MMARRANAWRIALLLALAAAALVFSATSGPRHIPLSALLSPGAADPDARLFWQLRVPRVCLAFLAGAILGTSGMTFQAMFRNPLADPYVLGVASGASLGAVLFVQAGLAFTVAGIPGISIFAFLGALGTIVLVYGLARARAGGFSPATMLLAGVAVNLFFSSLILFLQYMGDFYFTTRVMLWILGGLETVGFDAVLHLLPFAAVGLLVLVAYGEELNLLSTGEDLSATRGVNVPRVKTVLFLATSLLIGGAVAITGPIGFVGLMAPHICRLWVGPDHRVLAPATLIFGGTFLTLCDTLARTVVAPAELPVGVITAILGGPFFIWLLLHRGLDEHG
ncbi:MAG: iron ABC transporter permease [Planctomycetota bacterium]